MGYVRLKNGKREYLKSAPKYFFDGGTPVSDGWLVANENIYPVVDQDISDEVEVVEIIENPIEEWIVNEVDITRTFTVVKDDLPKHYDDFYQYLELNNEDKWVRDGHHLFRTYSIVDKTVDEVKIELKIKLQEKRRAIETGGYKFSEDDQGKYICINTDLESQSKLAIYALTLDPTYDFISWKSFDKFISLSPEQIKKLHLYITNFIKGCFENERRIVDLIDAADDYSELKEVYEEQFDKEWPTEASIYLSGE